MTLRVRICQWYRSPSLSQASRQHSLSSSSSSVIVFCISCSSTFLLSWSSFCAMDFMRRNRRVRPSLASADGSANDGTPRRGVSPEERRRLRSLLCGAGSARLPRRGAFGPRGASCASCTTSSLALAPVLSSQGGVLLQLHLLLLRCSTAAAAHDVAERLQNSGTAR